MNITSAIVGSTLGKVFGHVTYVNNVCWIVSVRVDIDGKDYNLTTNGSGTWNLTVAHRGWPRKVKLSGPTGRKVLALALFPQA